MAKPPDGYTGVMVGGTIMVVGYLVYETFLYVFPTAVLGVAGNIGQAAGGAALAFPLVVALERLDIMNRMK